MLVGVEESQHSCGNTDVEAFPFGVTDLGRAFVVDLRAGAKEVELPETECVVSLASQAAWYTFAMRFGLPTLGVSGRFKINHSETAFRALKKLGAAYSSGFYTKKAPRFGMGRRLCEFWWRRRRDVVPQFLARMPLFEEGRVQAFSERLTG